jgi:chemotaxis protein MotB
MTRRLLRQPPAPLRTSGDRWLFGYADVVTLLFACFASLYAAEAMTPPPVSAPDVLLPEEAPVEAAAPAPGPDPAAVFTAALGPDLASGLDIVASDRGVIISIAEAGTFAPARADLSAAMEARLAALTAVLDGMPNAIRVEGHTDDVPVRGGAFASNWELSTARATRVVQWLIERGGVDPARLSAAGYADHRPRVPNADEASRARNRRVDIVVLDADAARVEPPAGVGR